MQTLTPEELQALLKQQPTTGKGTQKARSRIIANVPVQPYDMQATLTLTPRQRALLRQWAEQLTQSLRYVLIPLLRMTLELRLSKEGLASLSELTEEWKAKAFVIPMTTTGRLRGDHYLALSANLAMVAIDRLLGGPGILPAGFQSRPLSRLEGSLLLRFAERIATSLIAVITGETENQSMHLQTVWTSEEQIGMLTDKVMVYHLCYDFQIGQEQGNLWVALRADALKGLEQTWQHKVAEPPQHLRHHPAITLTVPLRVVLATGHILIRELKELKVGDVVLLDGFKGEPVRLVWDNQTLCQARLGTRNGHWAVQILPTKQQRGEAQ